MQLLWKGLMTFVARFSIDLMFGCASFGGTDPEALALPLSYMHHFHPMPANVMVRARPELYVPMNRMLKEAIDPKEGLRSLPPLLKGYLRRRLRRRRAESARFGISRVYLFSAVECRPRYKDRRTAS
jgi:putative hemolysin